MTARRALNPCDNGITSDQNWPKQMLFHKVAVKKMAAAPRRHLRDFFACEQRGVNFYQFVQDYLSGKTRTVPPGPAQNQTAIAV